MSIEENPFTPSFGEIPVYLAGRREIIDACSRAFLSERRRPELTTLFSGARGTGKTALLSHLADLAEESGWISVNITALPGMLGDAEIQLRRNTAHLIDLESNLSIASVGIPDVISLSISEGEAPRSNWRSRMDDIFDQLSPQGIGVLFTVDEVDPTLDEMVHLAAVYQHFVREGRKVALLMAGLPHNISSLLNNKTVSFLRRSNRMVLDRIPDSEVSAALVRTAQAGNRSVDATALAAAAESIGGFPFMLQLVGYYAWDENPKSEVLGASDFARGAAIAQQEMTYRILDATFAELSPGDLRFVAAMLEDEGDSRIADLIERLGRSSSLVAQYRKRLIDAGVIGKRARGVVGFDLPYFRNYLQEKLDDGELLLEPVGERSSSFNE
ncbi:ATP-binding protein [Adlercreutzia sp. R7]|uniref:ATP-binding protein n=1 Tax=Adlercreutzia wanghongyangiae TaxID=3111451 RepID=A0ABU6IFC5_9ACTN|nr:ATP-binding protein [Adlercreutzia sp. R7]